MTRSDRFTELIYGERFDVKVSIFKFSALQTAYFSAKMLTIHHAFSPEEQTKETECTGNEAKQGSKRSYSSSELEGDEDEQERATYVHWTKEQRDVHKMVSSRCLLS